MTPHDPIAEAFRTINQFMLSASGDLHRALALADGLLDRRTVRQLKETYERALRIHTDILETLRSGRPERIQTGFPDHGGLDVTDPP